MLKEPVCGILKVAIMLQRVRVADEKASITARVELRPWVCCVSARMGSSFSSGTLGSSAAGQPVSAVPRHILGRISREI